MLSKLIDILGILIEAMEERNYSNWINFVLIKWEKWIYERGQWDSSSVFDLLKNRGMY